MAAGQLSDPQAEILGYRSENREQAGIKNHVNTIHQRTEIGSLLSQGRAAVERRLSGLFDEAAGAAKDRIVLCGAGPLGRRTLRGLRSAGIEPVGFVDNNSRLWNTEVDGLRVAAPREMVAAERDLAVFVVTIFNHSAVRRQLAEMGCRRVVSAPCLYWKFASAFLPYCSLGTWNGSLPNSRPLRTAPSSGLTNSPEHITSRSCDGG